MQDVDEYMAIASAKWRTAQGIRHRPYYIQRVAELQWEAGLGKAESYSELGWLHKDGIVDTRGRYVVKPALKKAFQCFEKAAKLGESSGLIALGNCYDEGHGVRQSREKALACYTKVWKEHHDSIAAANIATVHRDLGDLRQAFRWYRKAADTGLDGDAFVDIGYCLYYGIGVKSDKSKAVAAFRLACRSKFITDFGREEAYYHMAVASLDRTGRHNKPRIRKLLLRANVDDDYSEARELLAQLDENRVPVPCRCRRFLRRSIRGQASCALHRP